LFYRIERVRSVWKISFLSLGKDLIYCKRKQLHKKKIKFIFRDQLKMAKNRKLKLKDKSARLILPN